MPRRDGQPTPVHRLRPNDTVWTPPAVVFLDTETRWQDDGDDEVHQLRLWVAQRVDRRNVRKTIPAVEWGRGDTAAGLARWLDAQAVGRPCLWLYAHNLNFDLAVVPLPMLLAPLGWRVTDFSMRRGAPWLRLAKGSKTLTVCDSWSWIPTRLESLATLTGGHKPPLPGNGDGWDAWEARCAADVDLLARAVLALMDWWDDRHLGRWTISGAGSGWNAFRHRASGERHVMDVDPRLVSMDRDAVRGGRKDAQHAMAGGDGPWAELDLVAAYPTVAAHLPLPVKRAWEFDHLPLDSPWIASRFYGPVAEVVVRTDRPLYPVRHDGVTWYPVGEFATTLAGPELAAARDAGHLVAIGRGQMHKLGWALAPWARWVLDPTEGGTVEVPPVALVATKSWGRAVIGKFAARSHTAEALPGPATLGWSVTDAWDARVGRKASEVQMAGQAWWVTYDAEGDNAYPAVLAWVESEVRVRLGRVLDALGPAWWTCDTDGLIVELYRPDLWALSGVAQLTGRPRDVLGVAEALCDRLAGLVAPLVLRPKRVFDSLSVTGPQQLVAGGERRWSGVPAGAVESSPGKFTARDWPKLGWQIKHGRPGTYVRPVRTVTWGGPTVHRWVGEDGTCWPVEFRRDRRAGNVMVPWSGSRWAAEGVRLAPEQYVKLAPLR